MNQIPAIVLLKPK